MVVQDKPNYRDIPQGESGSNDRKQQRLRERFEVVKKLGQGTYGKVQLAINKETKQEVAIKTIKKAKIENEQDLVRIRREIQIMSSIHHPHIIHIYEVFENQEKIVLIMQYASGGELYDYLGCRKKLEENEARRVFRQVASAIFYCHKNHICHRDLKLENILLDDRGNAKIADFGLSNVFDEKFKLKTFCGSPLYASPEIVRGKPYCGPEVDCWSLGVLLYTLVYGAMPFDGSNFKRLVKQISEGEYFEPKEKSGASGLIRRLLTVDISLRATIRDICTDWWVNQGYDHSLLRVASDMAKLAPVRLDLLLAVSCTTSHAAETSVKNQVSTATKPIENRTILTNGYYSKSHPLHVPENIDSRRRTLATPDGYRANNTSTKDIGKLQNASSYSHNQQEDLKKGPGCLPLVEVMKTSAVKTPVGDKNESNTLLIVQDLIKDVISKVEQHINNSKMELSKSTETKLTQHKSLEDHSINSNGPLKEKVMTETSEGAPKSQLPQSPIPEGAKKPSVHNRVTTPVETDNVSQTARSERKSSVKSPVGPNTAILTTKLHGTYDELGGRHFIEKTVQAQQDTFSDRRKSIPTKDCDFQSRKSSVQIMEPDFVIPIFNVYSNIPKRSLDITKQSSTNGNPDLVLQSMASRLNESKVSDCRVKSNSEPLSENEDKVISNSLRSGSDQVSNTETQQNKISSDSRFGNTTADTQEQSTDTEVPKLPPRKRLLIKIPKIERSDGKDIVTYQCESKDAASAYVCDKQEDKSPRKEEMELQKEAKNSASHTDCKSQSPSAGSEDDTLVAVNKEEQTVKSSPKLPERKSRRDTSKRCLSFNSKSEMNREQGHVISEKETCKSRTENTENVSNIPEKELTSEHDVKLTADATSADGNKLVQKEDCSVVASVEERVEEVSENKTKNMDLSQKNDGIQKTEKSVRYEPNERHNFTRSNSSDVKDNSVVLQQRNTDSRRSRPLVRSKHRSLSRTRAMSLEFESLALMPMKILGPPKKPPGKVEIPKTFDPTQIVTSPKAEMREIIFIPTACVSENKEKIVKKIEKVKRAAIVIPPRRKSDAGISSRKKKYTRSKTDFIVRLGDLATSGEDANAVNDDEQDIIYREIDIQSGEVFSPENIDCEAASSEIWYSLVSPDNESEESEQRFKTFDEGADSYEGLYNDNDTADNENNKLHRHSVDAESGYWTPPDVTTAENSTNQTGVKMKSEKYLKNSEKVMLQRAAFRNSKMRMKLSDEGLDMCSLSSSLESGIYSWRQEEINGKRISPEGESALKVVSPMKFAEMSLDGSYPPIARSFKKMTFPPQHSSTSELSENFSMVGDTDKSANNDVGATGTQNRKSQQKKQNGDAKPIKPSDSQSSYGSNDISDDVFESWVEKEDVVRPSKKDSSEGTENRGTPNTKKNTSHEKKARNWQRGDTWYSFSTDKESSDNDDDLDLMIDEACQGVYGTEGLWQFLKSVNQNLSKQINTATKKIPPKTLCHRSKSQESKHPDDVVTQKRPVTRSLSREEKQRKGGTQLRHFVSEGKLVDADSMDCFEDSYSRFDDTRYSSGYMASESSLNDSCMLQKDFMSSVDSFNSNINDISLYGTLRKDKYFQSASALSSPCMTRRKKSVQTPYSSVDMSNLCDNADDISHYEQSKPTSLAEQTRKLSLYGTIRPKHLSQQGKAQSQILLSTADGYQLLYNERPKKDISLETRHGSLGALSSSVSKASSELNVSLRENTIKDYEKLLLSDPKNISIADPTYHSTRDKASPTVKKIISEKGNRRVSFSSDVKASKSDYHTSIRQNSLNKVREANEELLSTLNPKSSTYEEEQDSGSLLEALKTYGYRGIMSQKLQSNPERNEPRLNYRLPTECFLSTGVCSTDWDNFEYMPVENTFAYQQAMYTPLEPMEYYPSKALIRSTQMKRNIIPVSCDDDVTFNDILRSHRVSEEDFFSPRKPAHKYSDLSDLHMTHKEKYAGETWDTNFVSSVRKKSFDTTGGTLSSERRNSGSEKVLQTERERDKEGSGSADASEARASKLTENPIEVLSEKIQALKSRCQRKPSEESKPKKDLDDSGILASESQTNERIPGSESENERLHSCVDSVDDLTAQDSEPSESVSDRIWRKSFYSRFNDVSTTTTRRKKSSFADSEFLSGYNFNRNTGKFNVDEEGGVEEPWINTTLKRRNSRRSIPKQTVRASSLNSDATANSECSPVYYKRGTTATETEHKISRVIEKKRSPSQSNAEEPKTPPACDKSPFYPSKGELGSITRLGKNKSNTLQNLDSCDNKETRTSTKGSRTGTIGLNSNSDTGTNDLTNVSPTGRTESSVSKSEQFTSLLKATNGIPETDIKDSGSVANDTDIGKVCASEQKNDTPQVEDFSSSSEKSKVVPDLISDKNQGEDKATDSSSSSVNAIDTQEQKPETDKE